MILPSERAPDIPEAGVALFQDIEAEVRLPRFQRPLTGRLPDPFLLDAVHPGGALKQALRAFDLDQGGHRAVPGDQVDLPAFGPVAHADDLHAPGTEITDGRKLRAGEFVTVEITDFMDCDLVGRLI